MICARVSKQGYDFVQCILLLYGEIYYQILYIYGPIIKWSLQETINSFKVNTRLTKKLTTAHLLSQKKTEWFLKHLPFILYGLRFTHTVPFNKNILYLYTSITY